jgi:Leucine-rich repeat (LRR) protein
MLDRVRTLASFPRSLDKNELEEFESGAFSDVGALEVLDLEGNAIATLLDGLFNSLSNLEVLDLRKNPLGKIATTSFVNMPVTTRIPPGRLPSFPDVLPTCLLMVCQLPLTFYQLLS